MKVELHCHTSRYSACARHEPSELMEHFIRAGYGAVYLTEHDAVWPPEELAQLQRRFPAPRIFPGVELMVDGSLTQHIVVLGTSDEEYLKIRHDSAAVLRKARAEGRLTILAHPFRWEGGAGVLDGPELPDALEYHTGNQDGAAAHRSLLAALRLGLPFLNAGDVHGSDFINRFWIETGPELFRPDDIRSVVLERTYRNCIGDLSDAPPG